MKVQVTEKAKGELFIRAINKTVKAGAKVNLSEDEYQDSATQAAIQAGFLEPVDGTKVADRNGQEFINVYKNALSFKVINRSIPAGAKFFVSEEQVDDSEIQNAVDHGYIEPVGAKKTKKTVKAASAEADGSDRPKRKRSTKKSNTKTIKRVGKKDADAPSDVKVSVAKAPEESPMDDGPETHSMPKAAAAEVPDGMYAHDPTGEGAQVRRVPKPTDLFGDDDSGDMNFVDSTSKGEELSFVDDEQTKERAAQSGISDDIFDNNSEVE
jgi:hypothetical protein